jgi:hypothetical protein
MIRLTWSALLLLSGMTGRVAQAQCRTDSTSEAVVSWAKYIATSTDAEAVESRSSLSIPAVAASQVALVSDSKTCQKVVNAFATAAGVPATGRSLYIVKIGTRYVAKDPTLLVLDGWWKSMVFDSKFVRLSTFSG